MEKNKRDKDSGSGGGDTIVDVIGEDLLQVVLSKLPAKSFASAACVSRFWTAACRRVLSRPKLSSAVSLDASLRCAVEEVVDKVLSEPIRPHFAILSISRYFSLPLAHKYITEKLGSRTPVVSCKSRGIMGKNALTNEFVEIQCEMDYGFQIDRLMHSESYGISLTVGFVPGLKVDAIPLLWSKDFMVPRLEKFAVDIREHTNSISGCMSPTGIIMFGGLEVDMKPVLDKMGEYFYHIMTCIRRHSLWVMNAVTFLYSGVGDAGNYTHQKEHCAGVALLFMKDGNKPHGIGDIQFHIAISAGLTPIGPIFKAAAVKGKRSRSSTRLSATKGERSEYISGQSMLHDIEEELGDRIYNLYIGVTKRRKRFDIP